MIVGIDLGTTNSLVAIIHPESNQPVVLKEHDGTALVPSGRAFWRSRDYNGGRSGTGIPW